MTWFFSPPNVHPSLRMESHWLSSLERWKNRISTFKMIRRIRIVILKKLKVISAWLIFLLPGKHRGSQIIIGRSTHEHGIRKRRTRWNTCFKASGQRGHWDQSIHSTSPGTVPVWALVNLAPHFLLPGVLSDSLILSLRNTNMFNWVSSNLLDPRNIFLLEVILHCRVLIS